MNIDYCDGKVRVEFIGGGKADGIHIDVGVDGLKFQKVSMTNFGLPLPLGEDMLWGGTTT